MAFKARNVQAVAAECEGSKGLTTSGIEINSWFPTINGSLLFKKMTHQRPPGITGTVRCSALYFAWLF